MNTPSTSVSPGLGGFIAFFVLALALWLLMRNMNGRMRRMSYRAEQERKGAAGDGGATAADGAGAGGHHPTDDRDGPNHAVTGDSHGGSDADGGSGDGGSGDGGSGGDGGGSGD